MKPTRIIWSILVLFFGFILAGYAIAQYREPTPWILGAFAFYAGAVIATFLALFWIQ